MLLGIKGSMSSLLCNALFGLLSKRINPQGTSKELSDSVNFCISAFVVL